MRLETAVAAAAAEVAANCRSQFPRDELTDTADAAAARQWLLIELYN